MAINLLTLWKTLKTGDNIEYFTSFIELLK